MFSSASVGGSGGNVLLPVTLCGSTLDLIYELGTQLPQLGVATNQSTIYLISPIANNVLGYCEIMAEWLHQVGSYPRP